MLLTGLNFERFKTAIYSIKKLRIVFIFFGGSSAGANLQVKGGRRPSPQANSSLYFKFAEAKKI